MGVAFLQMESKTTSKKVTTCLILILYYGGLDLNPQYLQIWAYKYSQLLEHQDFKFWEV